MTEEKLRVLVVDDNDDIRGLLRVSFDLDGRLTVVEEANRGDSAVLLARKSPAIDAVVLDYHMPGGTGLDVLPALREALPDATIVLYSSDDTVLAEAVAIGADAALPKDTPRDELADVLLTQRRR